MVIDKSRQCPHCRQEHVSLWALDCHLHQAHHAQLSPCHSIPLVSSSLQLSAHGFRLERVDANTSLLICVQDKHGVAGDKASVEQHLRSCQSHPNVHDLHNLLASLDIACINTPLPLSLARPLPLLTIEKGWQCSVCGMAVAGGGSKPKSKQKNHTNNAGHGPVDIEYTACSYQKWFLKASSADRMDYIPTHGIWQFVRVPERAPSSGSDLSIASEQHSGFDLLKMPIQAADTHNVFDRREQASVVNRFNLAPLAVVETMRSHLALAHDSSGINIAAVDMMSICKEWVVSVNSATEEIPDSTRCRLTSTSSVFPYLGPCITS